MHLSTHIAVTQILATRHISNRMYTPQEGPRRRGRPPRNPQPPPNAGAAVPHLPGQQYAYGQRGAQPSSYNAQYRPPGAGGPSSHPYGHNAAPGAMNSRPVYRHPQTHPPGALPFFVPPPGQTTLDPSLSNPPDSQGFYSTYASRLRTGVTGLIQPDNISGGPREREYFLAEMEREMVQVRSGSGTSTPRFESPAPFTSGRGSRAAAAASTLSGRRSRVVNYAEKASDDEADEESSEEESDEVIGEAASDPDDTDYGSKKKARVEKDRSAGALLAQQQQSTQTQGLDAQTAMRVGRLRKKKEELDRGWTWLGDRVPGDRVRSKRVMPTKHIYISEELLEREAEKPELLVPITIDLEVPSDTPDAPGMQGQGIKIKDRFLWNINEPFISPNLFAQIFCDDLDISPRTYAPLIAELISNQVEEAQGIAEIDVVDEEVTEEDVVWSDEEVEDVMEVDENGDEYIVEKVWAESDCRVTLNLDIQIYTHLLRDRIEWDLSSTLSPYIFAKSYAADLGLTGEAIPLIAHALTEEILKHKKDALDLELFAQAHPDEQGRWERSLPLPRVTNRKGSQRLAGVWRDWWEREEYGPVMVELTLEEMEKRELERMREARRVMRTLTGIKRRR